MPLTEDEIELLARQRMLKNVLNEVIEVVHQADSRLGQEMEETISEFVDTARRECADAGDTDQILECIMEVKQDQEGVVRDRIQRLS